jgi:hypothetical protein
VQRNLGDQATVTSGLLENFIDLIRSTRERDDPSGLWRHEDAAPDAVGQLWISGENCAAAAAISQCIDRIVNDRVCEEFRTRSWEELDRNIDLDSIMYPDHGLYHVRVEQRCLALELQEIRSNLLEASGGLCSMVLYGPPGTGKTTLVEALARSAKVRFLELTPSDLLVEGEQNLEARAREVFELLTLLRDAVILFDEFDSVVRRRNPDAVPGGNGALDFLTPGMLPKLKALRGAARSQRLAFFLCTNLVHQIDEAAIREGRFDRQRGVFPPDLLSRTGFLSKGTRSASAARLGKTLRATAHVQMDLWGRLFKPGGQGWRYLAGEAPTIPERQEPDVPCPRAAREPKLKVSRTEWAEWKAVEWLEERFGEGDMDPLSLDWEGTLREARGHVVQWCAPMAPR